MKKLILILLLSVAITSCSKEDDNQKQLSGTWILVNVDCFCGFDPAINNNSYKLIFTEGKNELVLENPAEGYSYIAESGTYNYTLDGNVLKVKNLNFTYKIEGENLTLSFVDNPQIADDELDLTYKKG